MVGTLGVFIVPLSMFDPLLISLKHSDSRIYGSFPRGDGRQGRGAEYSTESTRQSLEGMVKRAKLGVVLPSSLPDLHIMAVWFVPV